MEEIAVKEERARLAMSANVNASGEFEVLAISAGEGNGWQFSPESLRGSLPLWEGVETFVDHTPEPRLGHSLRDLAGICREPRYDEERKGVVVRLRPSGPSAALLQELGRQWLEEPGRARGWAFRPTWSSPRRRNAWSASCACSRWTRCSTRRAGGRSCARSMPTRRF